MYTKRPNQAPNAWLVVPAQTVDATPSNALIRQCLPPGEPICLAALGQNLARVVFRLT
jgi:hypothetical protein